jgi:hypothetical protein
MVGKMRVNGYVVSPDYSPAGSGKANDRESGKIVAPWGKGRSVLLFLGT